MTTETELAGIVGLFLRTEGDRSFLLGQIQGRLPSWIRVYDDNGLKVYVDKVLTPLPTVISFAAIYIEQVNPDGSATVLKGGLGPTTLAKNTEPKILSALDRILGDEELM